jgi:hypothetical protein
VTIFLKKKKKRKMLSVDIRKLGAQYRLRGFSTFPCPRFSPFHSPTAQQREKFDALSGDEIIIECGGRYLDTLGPQT